MMIWDPQTDFPRVLWMDLLFMAFLYSLIGALNFPEFLERTFVGGKKACPQKICLVSRSPELCGTFGVLQEGSAEVFP